MRNIQTQCQRYDCVYTAVLKKTIRGQKSAWETCPATDCRSRRSPLIPFLDNNLGSSITGFLDCLCGESKYHTVIQPEAVVLEGGELFAGTPWPAHFHYTGPSGTKSGLVQVAVSGANYHEEFYPSCCGEDRNHTHRMAYVRRTYSSLLEIKRDKNRWRTVLLSQRETSQTFLESRECWRELPAAKGVLRGETSEPDWSSAGRR